MSQERDAYLPLAESGSTLFFVISDLAKLNNMYRFSLSAFLRLFQRSLETKQVKDQVRFVFPSMMYSCGKEILTKSLLNIQLGDITKVHRVSQRILKFKVFQASKCNSQFFAAGASLIAAF